MSKKKHKKIEQISFPERKIKKPEELKADTVPEKAEEAAEITPAPEEKEAAVAEVAVADAVEETQEEETSASEVSDEETPEEELVEAEGTTESEAEEPKEVQIKEWKQAEPAGKDAEKPSGGESEAEKKTGILKWAGIVMLGIVVIAGIVLVVTDKNRDTVAVSSDGALATPTAAVTVTQVPEPTEAVLPTPSPTLVPEPTETPSNTPTPTVTVTPIPTVTPTAAATPTPTVTPTPIVVGDIDVSKYAVYSNKFEGWGIGRNSEHEQPTAWGYDTKYKFDEVGAYYVDKNATEDDKVIYLTFNCGYEVGYTDGYLEILKKHDVKATFFVLEEYIRQCPEQIRWLMENGYLVGSHSAYHLNYGTDTPERIIADMLKNEQRMRDYVGLEMHKVMRPPSGYYNEQALHIMQDLGYKTYFWSLGYADWDPNDQPSEEYILNHFKNNHHNGAIPVIHITSGNGLKVLDEVITMLKAEGYRFGLVTEIE